MAQVFRSFEFGNGSRMSNKNLVILEFKYLQNKKWYKYAVKTARIKKRYRTYYFHFTPITDKNSQFSLKYWWFSTFTMLSLHSWSSVDADFLFLQSVWCQERSGLSTSRTFHPQGVKQKRHVKKHEILAFKPLLQNIQLKNLTSRKIFWSSNI